MSKRQIFYSFHYSNDVFRVQQIRNIGALEANTPVSANDWETIKRAGDKAIESWINENMKYRSCVIVLIGEDTANRPWVQYEIKKAWEEKKGLMGIYIHNLNCPRNGKSSKGVNPFSKFRFGDKSFSEVVPCFDPNPKDAYDAIANNIEKWIEFAISNRNKY